MAIEIKLGSDVGNPQLNRIADGGIGRDDLKTELEFRVSIEAGGPSGAEAIAGEVTRGEHACPTKLVRGGGVIGDERRGDRLDIAGRGRDRVPPGSVLVVFQLRGQDSGRDRVENFDSDSGGGCLRNRRVGVESGVPSRPGFAAIVFPDAIGSLGVERDRHVTRPRGLQ